MCSFVGGGVEKLGAGSGFARADGDHWLQWLESCRSAVVACCARADQSAGTSEWHRELERPPSVMDRASDDVSSVTITRADECSPPRVKVKADAFLVAAEIKPRDDPGRLEIGRKDMLDYDRRQIIHWSWAKEGTQS